jgi:NAD(P)-dependent dehydrogenase (short-subunit alcohol dehydrogenase family)
MTEAGAIVHYYSADVRDEVEFGGRLDQLQERFGPLAGVIHGAGVIEDRLLRDKTPESFDRIFQTKVVGARILTERRDPARLDGLGMGSEGGEKSGGESRDAGAGHGPQVWSKWSGSTPLTAVAA